MKRTVFGIGALFLFAGMLSAPESVFTGAGKGLLLWFQIVLPTLFPFLVLTNLLLVTGYISCIGSAVGGVFSRIFRVSGDGSFAVLSGFLCGYPLGAKTAADMTASRLISPEEGRYLLSFCNNASPAFILNYLVLNTLGEKRLFLPSLGILFAAPVLVSLVTRRKYLGKRQCFQRIPPKIRESTVCASCEKPEDFSASLTDKCIMDSFETLVKVGGYIMLFSVLFSLCGRLLAIHPVFSLLLALLEVTNGISLVGSLSLPMTVRFPLLLGITAFGGLCAAAQTMSVVQKAGFPMLPYITEKLAAALTASSLGFLYIYLF